MPAYLIVSMHIEDREMMARYQAAVLAARGMLASPENEDIAALRQDATRSNIVIVDGYKP